MGATVTQLRLRANKHLVTVYRCYRVTGRHLPWGSGGVMAPRGQLRTLGDITALQDIIGHWRILGGWDRGRNGTSRVRGLGCHMYGNKR